MVHCKNCVHWTDESIAAIEADREGKEHIFMGCSRHGQIENFADRSDCPDFTASDDLYVICDTCKITVPKVCVSLGECANCTDTDLYCVESCSGGESRKYCTHFVRLHSEGMQLIDAERQEVFDLFPTLDMPGAAPGSGSAQRKTDKPATGKPARKGQNALHKKSNR